MFGWRRLLRNMHQMMRDTDIKVMTARGALPRRHLPLLLRHRSLFLLLFLAVMGLTLFVASLLAYQRPSLFGLNKEPKDITQYTIVIDAGSSGSRLLIYKQEAAVDGSRFPDLIKVGDNVPEGSDTCAEKASPGDSFFPTHVLHLLHYPLAHLSCD